METVMRAGEESAMFAFLAVRVCVSGVSCELFRGGLRSVGLYSVLCMCQWHMSRCIPGFGLLFAFSGSS